MLYVVGTLSGNANEWVLSDFCFAQNPVTLTAHCGLAAGIQGAAGVAVVVDVTVTATGPTGSTADVATAVA